MPLSTTTLDYRLYLMALLLEEHFQPGKLQAIRIQSPDPAQQQQTYTFSIM